MGRKSPTKQEVRDAAAKSDNSRSSGDSDADAGSTARRAQPEVQRGKRDAAAAAEVSGADRERAVQELTQQLRALKERYVRAGRSEREIEWEFLRHVKQPRPLARGWLAWLWRHHRGAVLRYVLPLLFAVAMLGALRSRAELYDAVTQLAQSRCLLENNPLVMEMARPLTDCEPCRGIRTCPVVRNVTRQEFLDKYAYTGVPVLIKDATTNWTAVDKFSYRYLRDLYKGHSGALDVIDEECQFFPYNTEFQALSEAFNMTDDRADYKAGEKPWYFGWSNCHTEVADKLRQHYERPYFLPTDSESSAIDWIFMGGQGPGAHIHLDSVSRPSWQAQLSGKKTWTLIPVPECENICHSMEVTVEKGDIIVLNTNEWYHATKIHPGDISITIGSEYD